MTQTACRRGSGSIGEQLKQEPSLHPRASFCHLTATPAIPNCPPQPRTYLQVRHLSIVIGSGAVSGWVEGAAVHGANVRLKVLQRPRMRTALQVGGSEVQA